LGYLAGLDQALRVRFATGETLADAGSELIVPMYEILAAILKTGTGSAIGLALAAAAAKIIAVTVGPSGFGLFSLLRQTYQTAIAFATLGGLTAVVQGISSQAGRARTQYVVTAGGIFLLGGLAGSMVLFFMAPQWAHWVLGRRDLESVLLMRWLSLPLFLGVLQAYASGVLNGHRAVGKLALVHSANGAALAILAYPAAYLVVRGDIRAFAWLLGAVALVSASLASLFVIRAGWLTPAMVVSPSPVSAQAARHFFTVAGPMLMTGLVSTGTLLALRALIARQFALSGAGFFDAAWTLGTMYTVLLLMSFMTYYLPTLSQTTDLQARLLLIGRMLRLSTSLLVILITAVIVLKPFVVSMLYSDKFHPALSILRWMLIAEYFRTSGQVFVMPILGRADMKTYSYIEVGWNAGFFVLSALAVLSLAWLPGVGLAYLIMYAAYLVYAFLHVRAHENFRVGRSLLWRWIIGLLIVAGSSVHSWTDAAVRSSVAVPWLVLAGIFAGSALPRESLRKLARQFRN
jgi:O-antigen/teichoic acid export membrane protein